MTDNATCKTRLMPAAGHRGIRTVYRSWFRADPAAPWQTVRNADGNPIAYTSADAALAAAELMRGQVPGPFCQPWGSRELHLGADPVPAFLFDKGYRREGDGAPVLSPTEADELGRLICAALNAYPAAREWAAKRKGAAHVAR